MRRRLANGLCKTWTPGQEERYQRRLAGCCTFAERHTLMTIMDILKYDGRTREGKRAIARGRLRMVTATDHDLKELAQLEQLMSGQDRVVSVSERVEELKKERAALRKRGVKRSELECRKNQR